MAAMKSSTMRGSTAAAVSLLAIAGAAACTTAGSVLAQSYPSRPVRVIVPFPPGSAPDQIMRFVTQHMAQASGQPFIMDNRPGANGNIGVEVAARATPDGYTLVSANNTTFAGNVSLYRKLPFEIQKDFTPVARFITTGLMLAVRNDLPAKDLREFITLAHTRRSDHRSLILAFFVVLPLQFVLAGQVLEEVGRLANELQQRFAARFAITN